TPFVNDRRQPACVQNRTREIAAKLNEWRRGRDYKRDFLLTLLACRNITCKPFLHRHFSTYQTISDVSQIVPWISQDPFVHRLNWCTRTHHEPQFVIAKT